MVQRIGRIDSIAHPSNVAEVVFFPLIYLNMYVHMLLVGLRDAVLHDVGIAIAPLIEFLDDVLLILGIFVGNKFLGAQEIAELVHFARLGHGTFHRIDLLAVQSLYVNVTDLGLVVLVNVNRHVDVILLIGVVGTQDVGRGILEALFLKIVEDNDFGTVNGIRTDLVVFLQADFAFQILALRFLDTRKLYV